MIETANPASPPHRWTFFRRGGLDQAALQTGQDLVALETLDLKLWVALACPSRGLELDPRTLALLDADADNRIRAADILAAVKWAAARLKDPGDLLNPSDTLPLASLQDRTPEGAALVESARRILGELGETHATAISLDVLGEPEKLFPTGQINGDGVVPPEAAGDDGTRQLIQDIMDTCGATTGRTGTKGVTQEQVEAFFTELEAYCDWADTGAPAATAGLGDKTDAAYAAVEAVRAKVDDYFARCRVAAFDHRAQPALNRSEDEFAPLGPKTLEASVPELASFPVAHVAPARALPLTTGVNPAWAGAIGQLRTDAVAPVFGDGKAELTEADWARLQEVFAPYVEWLKQKPDGKAQGVGLARAKEILGGSGRAGLMALLTQDAELGPAYDAFGDLERLIRYRRDLFSVLQNFVNFADFYSRDRWAMFQAGELYLDSRSCELCIRVDDPATHVTLAAMSLVCIAYVQCKRPGESPFAIAACFTQGDSDYLYVGRHGVFYDRAGKDWDATIVKFIDNPISLRQAFFAPYKKLVRFVEEQVAKRAGAAESAPGAALGALESAGGGPSAGKKLDVGTVAALGVAVGGITSALGIVFSAIAGRAAWIPVGICGILVLISGPSVLIAWLKLRQRTLGPILEASGWAINGRVQITMPLGHALTDRARLPWNAIRHLKDPYRRRSYAWLWITLLLLAALVAGGLYAAHQRHFWPFQQQANVAPVRSR